MAEPKDQSPLLSRAPLARLRPLGVGDILDGAIALYRQNLGTLCGIVILTVGLAEAVLVPFHTAIRLTIHDPANGRFVAYIIAWLVDLAALSVVTTFAGGALTLAVHDALIGTHCTARQALRAALPCLPRLVAAAIVQLVLLGSTTGAITLVGTLAWNAWPDAAGPWLFGAAVLIAVLLALGVLVALFLVQQVIVLEDCGVLDALVRSAGLMLRRSDRRRLRGTLAKAGAIVFVVTVLSAVVPVVSQAPEMLWRAYAAFQYRDMAILNQFTFTAPLAVSLPSDVLRVLLSCAVVPVGVTAMVLLYLDIRMRTEGYDLMLRLQNLEPPKAVSA